MVICEASDCTCSISPANEVAQAVVDEFGNLAQRICNLNEPAQGIILTSDGAAQRVGSLDGMFQIVVCDLRGIAQRIGDLDPIALGVPRICCSGAGGIGQRQNVAELVVGKAGLAAQRIRNLNGVPVGVV